MTIIIPFKNNPNDLAALLMQFQCQRVLPRCIYLIDSSEDKVGQAIATRMQWSVPIIVDPVPKSIYASWNAGIKFAPGDVVIINDDVMVPWDFCEVMYQFLASEQADMYCPDVSGFPPVGRVRPHYQWYASGKIEGRVAIEEAYPYVPTMTGWCFGLPRTTIDKYGLFDEQFQCWYGDKDYEKRLFQGGGMMMFINGLPVHHFGTASYGKLPKEEHGKMNYQDQLAFEKKWKMEHTNFGWEKYK